MKCSGDNNNAALPKDFTDKVEFTDTCWLWKAAKLSTGYGACSKLINKKRYSAHRFSWMCFNGEIPKAMVVCHKCDVRHCVNPDHLFLGTHKDNMRDMVQKGRSAKGERQGAYTHPESVLRGEKASVSKLTQIQVDEIRRTYKRGTHLKCDFSTRGLAMKFGVTQQCILKILKNETWKQRESV